MFPMGIMFTVKIIQHMKNEIEQKVSDNRTVICSAHCTYFCLFVHHFQLSFYVYCSLD